MLEIDVLLISILSTLIINFVLKRKNFCLDKKFYSHKSFATKALTPISGGIIFSLLFILFFPNEDLYFKILILLLFVIGFLSDINYLISPTKRFFFQIFVITIFLFFTQNFINTIRIPFFDYLLENIYFKYFFTLLCLLVLINGSNFIDGMNTLFLGYYLMIGIILLLLTKELQIINSIMPLNIMVSILFIIFIFNFFGKLFSGDSGAYSISFVLGFFMINLVNLSEKISPYFIACLLWYPAYECLFSILRKSVKNKFLTKADNKHLHHLIFSFFKEKTKFKSENINLLTGLSINLFNLIIFFNAYNNVSQTKNLIFLIFISSSLYTFLYFYLSKNLSD